MTSSRDSTQQIDIQALGDRLEHVEQCLREIEQLFKKRDVHDGEFNKTISLEVDQLKALLQTDLAILHEQLETLSNKAVESVHEARRTKQLRQAFFDIHLALETIVKDLDYRHKALLSSRRWRLGNAAIQILDRMHSRRKVKLAIDVIGEDIAQMNALVSRSLEMIANLEIPERKVAHVPKPNARILATPSDSSLSPNFYRLSTRERVVFYTALVGDYDCLPQHHFLPLNADFVLFTDNDLSSEFWDVRPLPYYHNDSARIARYVKTHPHELLNEYDISIWMDANMFLVGDFNIYLNKLNDRNIWLGWKHLKRTDIFAEVDACVQLDKDQKDVLTNQVDRYRSEGFKESWLYETGILARIHNDSLCVAINTDWWKEIGTFGKCDQISLPYVLWKHGYKAPYFRNDDVEIGKDHVIEYSSKHEKNHNQILSQDYAVGLERERFIQMLNSWNEPIVNFIVCIHNALEDVIKCLNSILITRCQRDQLILVDDGSGDETKAYVREFAEQNDNVQLIRNEKARGYTKAANQGLKHSKADYYSLINSDTILPKGFRQKIVTIGESNSYLGVFGPMSNAAGWQSIPEIFDDDYKFAINKLNRGHTCDSIDRLCNSLGYSNYIHVPLVNGFCYTIKHSVIEKIGYLDEKTFPVGYGEEDDYSLRATDAGFHCGICTGTYVWHAKSKSFGQTTRKDLSKQGREFLRGKYGASRLTNAATTLRTHPGLTRFRASIKELLNTDHASPQDRLTNGIPRIGVICAGDPQKPPANTYTRILMWLEALSNKYSYRLFRLTELDEIDSYVPNKVIIQGIPGTLDEVESFLQWCTLRHVPIQLDVDDNLLGMPKRVNLSSQDLDNLNVTMQKTIFAAENVVVSTEMLKSLFCKLNRRVSILPNHLSSKHWQSLRYGMLRKKEVKDELKIVCLGTENDGHDLDLIISATANIKREFPRVRLTLIRGTHRNQNSSLFDIVNPPAGCLEYPSFVEWFESHMEAFHIGIAPLRSGNFNNCRSDLIFLEYAAVGLLGIYSDVEPYQIVKEKQLGLVSGNREAEWYKNIREAVLRYNDLHSMRQSAFDYVKQYRVLEDNLDSFDPLLNHADKSYYS